VVSSLSVVVARNIRAERARAGLTQEDLAGALGLTRSAISSWERGLREPGLNYLVPLCGALGVDLADLFRGIPAGDLRLLGLQDLRARA
jgi:transcriptional regulator with XRE-family HTH domain